MKIETKYDVGQTVWYLCTEYPNVECPACVEGRITGRDGKDYHCHNCDGTGTVELGRPMIVPKLRVITRIVSVVTSNGIKITCHDDDICSLRLDEMECYPTESEAQAEADRRNGATP